MTDFGICHNADMPRSRLTPETARIWRLKWARSITYYSGGNGLAWQRTIESARALRAVGTQSLVVFNTEAYGGAVKDIGRLCSELERFLDLAGGAVAAIEPGNELDTPGWTEDGRPIDDGGAPIGDQLIIDIGAAAADVCSRYGVLCLAPSLLSGPGEGRFEAIARGLVGSKVHGMAVHPYGRSAGGHPSPGWIWGTIEDAADECDRLGHGFRTWFTELGCWTRRGDLGEAKQREFVRAAATFQHRAIEMVSYFALNDWVVPDAEMAELKDWGIFTRAGTPKLSAAALPTSIQLGQTGSGGQAMSDLSAWAGKIGSGLLDMMAQDGTRPAQRGSTWLPLGVTPSDVEQCYGENGTLYVWLLGPGTGHRFPADQ